MKHSSYFNPKDDHDYRMVGLILGWLLALAGCVLIAKGVEGKVSWTLEFLGTRMQLLDSIPGFAVVVAGIILVMATKK